MIFPIDRKEEIWYNSIQRDEGAQALENHLNVIDSKKSLRIEYLAKQLKSCDAKLKGL